MDGLMQDLIIMLSFGIFGVVVIIKHFALLNEIKRIKKELANAREIGDLSKMQNDIIELKQNCINIDAKYKIKDEWTTNRLQQVIDIMQQQMSVQDAINTFDNAKELVKSYEKGAGIKDV